MQPKQRKLVWEIAEDARFIVEMVGTKSEQELVADKPIRYIFERALQNCGEAMVQLDRLDPVIASRFT
ncbi:MAG TPA: hypothetical protein PK819_06170, partial [Thermomicrobiales bacterium]|nr:hypothetical protein [Thermomicrobiales bacterium]